MARSRPALGHSLAPLLLAAALAGCASGPTTPARLSWTLDDLPAGTALVWPAPPELARFAYAGSLTGERNFIADTASVSRLRAFGRWLVGLDDNERALALQRPVTLVGDAQGRLYVSDASRQAVLVFDTVAGKLQLWDKAGGVITFRSPSGLALLPGGGLLVADADLGAVVQLDAQGEPRGEIGRGQLKRPTGLALDPATGLVFVADTQAHDIKVFDLTGALRHVVGRRGDALGEFNAPTHLSWARGELYVTDTFNHRVQVLGGPGLSGAGDLHSRAIGARGLQLGDLVRPKGVAVDADGRVYVVESYYDSLLVYGADGEFLLPIGAGAGAAGLVPLAPPDAAVPAATRTSGTPSAATSATPGATTAGAGTPAAPAPTAAPAGAGTTSASDPGGSPALWTAAGRFYLPAGVWIDADNQIFVADMYKGRVVRLKFLVAPGSHDPALTQQSTGDGR